MGKRDVPQMNRIKVEKDGFFRGLESYKSVEWGGLECELRGKLERMECLMVCFTDKAAINWTWG